MGTESEPKIHLNVGGPRGWTTACGIESASFVEAGRDEESEVSCKLCRRAMNRDRAKLEQSS